MEILTPIYFIVVSGFVVALFAIGTATGSDDVLAPDPTKLCRGAISMSSRRYYDTRAVE